MKAKEIIEIIQNATEKNFFEIRELIPADVDVSLDLNTNAVFLTVDFRRKIRLFLEINRIKIKEFADIIHCPRNTMYDYLNHSRDFPYKYLERALAFIELASKN